MRGLIILRARRFFQVSRARIYISTRRRRVYHRQTVFAAVPNWPGCLHFRAGKRCLDALRGGGEGNATAQFARDVCATLRLSHSLAAAAAAAALGRRESTGLHADIFFSRMLYYYRCHSTVQYWESKYRCYSHPISASKNIFFKLNSFRGKILIGFGEITHVKDPKT